MGYGEEQAASGQTSSWSVPEWEPTASQGSKWTSSLQAPEAWY